MSNISFNETFYLSTYPDVAAAVSRGVIASGQAHYQSNGRFEGRNPNQFFNTSEYLGRYPDVARAGVNPLTHFLTSGAAEGRFANSNEDAAIDLNNNDVADDFNNAAYLALYPDVAAQTGAGRPFATAYQHFVQFGQFEGRTGTLSNGATVTGPFVNGATTTPVTPGTTAPSINGSTITLTANLDGPGAVSPAANTNGTANNDLYIASQVELTNDTINGGAGIDTLRLSTSAAITGIPTLISVERVELTANSAGSTLNLTNATGLTTLVSSGGANNAGFSNVKNIVTAEINNTSAGSFNLGYDAAVVVGTADAQNVAVNNSKVGTLTLNGIETVNIASTGSNTIAALNGTTIGALNVTGAGTTTITGALEDTVKIVDASKATGALTVSLGVNDSTVTGGTGNDVVNFGTNYTAADKFDGGAGLDYIGFTNLSNGLIANSTNITNIEGVLINQASVNGTINVDNFAGTGNAITNFRFGTDATVNNSGIVLAGTANITNAVTGSTVFANTDAALGGALNFTLKTNGAADVLNVRLINTDTTAGTQGTQGLTALTANQIETLNIDSSKLVLSGTTIDATEVQTIGTLNANSAMVLNISGDNNIALGTLAGSSLTALASVVSTSTANVALGTIGGQAFSTSATGATITTLAGNDSVQLSVGTTGVLKAVDLGVDTLATTGAGDTLGLSGGGLLTGVTIINLASTTDQVQQLLGSANGDAQIGIENVNLSGLTGSAQISGSAVANVLVGTAGADTIGAAAGNDVITGGVGVDILSGGAGTDSFIFATGDAVASTNFVGTVTPLATQTVVTDAITDFATGDFLTINRTGGGNLTADATNGGTVGTLQADEYLLVRGTYNAATNTFTSDVAGTATALTYDSNAAGGITQETIVLVGTLPTEITFAAGNVFTHA